MVCAEAVASWLAVLVELVELNPVDEQGNPTPRSAWEGSKARDKSGRQKGPTRIIWPGR